MCPRFYCFLFKWTGSFPPKNAYNNSELGLRLRVSFSLTSVWFHGKEKIIWVWSIISCGLVIDERILFLGKLSLSLSLDSNGRVFQKAGWQGLKGDKVQSPWKRLDLIYCAESRLMSHRSFYDFFAEIAFSWVLFCILDISPTSLPSFLCSPCCFILSISPQLDSVSAPTCSSPPDLLKVIQDGLILTYSAMCVFHTNT